jgi:hypothetical protein
MAQFSMLLPHTNTLNVAAFVAVHHRRNVLRLVIKVRASA